MANKEDEDRGLIEKGHFHKLTIQVLDSKLIYLSGVRCQKKKNCSTEEGRQDCVSNTCFVKTACHLEIHKQVYQTEAAKVNFSICCSNVYSESGMLEKNWCFSDVQTGRCLECS